MTDSELPPPAPDAFDGELRCIVCHARVNHAFVTVNIVSSISNGCALRKTRIIVDVHLWRLAFLMPFLPVILKVSDTFFLLRVHRNDWLSLLQKPFRRAIDVTKLPFAVRVRFSFFVFLVGLQ